MAGILISLCEMANVKRVLVVGSTGYIGTRLVGELLHRGYVVNAAFRTPAKIEKKPWSSHPNLIPVETDVFDVESLISASKDCMAAFYLVHSMYGKGDFAALDREAAENMAMAAEKAGLKRLIYLGGLGETESGLSKHLASRMEVGRILHQGAVPATTLRAAMIIGAGSASFEIMRYLADRLPAMVTPSWVRTKNQPIAVSNAIGYLIDCLENSETADRVFDIGGPDVLSYQDLIQIYSEEAGLTRRFIVPFPLLSPRLSSYWISLVTPLPAPLAKPLIEGLKNEAICQNSDIQSIIPQNLLSIREAIRLALEQTKHKEPSTKGELHETGRVLEWAYEGDPQWAGGSSFWLTWRSKTRASRTRVWNAIQSVIGSMGWNYGSSIWQLRGYLDLLIRGKGMGVSTKHLSRLKIGSLVDCWQLIGIIPKKRLQLMATLKMPSTLLLSILLKDKDMDYSELAVELHYHPHGLAGLLAWYGLMPFRKYAIEKLIDRILHLSESSHFPKSKSNSS